MPVPVASKLPEEACFLSVSEYSEHVVLLELKNADSFKHEERIHPVLLQRISKKIHREIADYISFQNLRKGG
jgi:hypothetical protein